jgi:transcriptional regulator with XRE-family HTH domain
MKLAAWLKQNDLTQKEFCELANRSNERFSYHALSKWCAGQRIPRPKEMGIIVNLTNGDVQPNDFYALEKPAVVNVQ